MPSYLGDYPGAAKNREDKFVRAVNSFIRQKYENIELIIVADGCNTTAELYHDCLHDSSIKNIVLSKVTKQKSFAGFIRNVGILHATGDIICYLDTDDMFEYEHLYDINAAFNSKPGTDWVYSNDWAADNNGSRRERNNKLEYGRVGTSAIAHKKHLRLLWPDGYGHDWKFIESLMVKSDKFFKTVRPNGYTVCHIPNVVDY